MRRLAFRAVDPRRALLLHIRRVDPTDDEVRAWRWRILAEARLLASVRAHRESVATLRELEQEACDLLERFEDAKLIEAAWFQAFGECAAAVLRSRE